MPLIMLVGPLTDWLFELAAGAAAAIAGFVADMKRIQFRHGDRLDDVTSELELETEKTRLDRLETRQDGLDLMIERQKRYFTGDEEDPSQPGLLEEIHEISENQQEIRKTVREIQEDLNHDER
jgi:hypothetical protein